MTTETNQEATPSVTPAVPAVTAPVAPPTVTIQTEYQFEATGHASLDYALRYLGKQGIGPDHPAVVAAQQGNWSAMDVLAQERKLDTDVLALGKSGFTELQSKQQAGVTAFHGELDKAAKDAGLADWNAVKAFAAANSNPEELKAVNAVLAKGDAASKLLAQALIQRAASVPANRDGATAVKQGASTVPPTTGAVTAKAYQEGVIALQSKYGVRYAQTPEFRALAESRLAARRAGL